MLNRKTLFAIAISLALLLSPLIHPLAPRPAQAATLLSETFQNATAPNWTFGGNPNPPVLTASTIDPAGQGWLRLTTSDQNQTGFVFNDLPVPSTNGFVINFDFAVFGGSGADGFTFFLMDGTVPAPYPGAFGGSLGYAQRETGALPADPDVLGLSQGYVGIGFDEWGNYSNDNEGRQGGLPGPTLYPNRVAIRGPYDPANPLLGYNYVADSGVLPDPLEVPSPPPGQNHPDQTGLDHRHATIIITPTGLITVQIQFGAGTAPVTVIDSQPIGATAPSTVLFGFAGSTGSSTNYHEIRNFAVTEIVDVAVTKSHVGDFTAGTSGSFTVTVSNVSPAPSTASATNITVTDTLPAGLTFASGTGLGWSCGAVLQDVTCTNPGPLAAGASSDITLTVDVGAAAVPGVANTATVSAPGDSNPANNSSTDNVTVNAAAAVDLAVAKSHVGDFTVGIPGSFTVTVSNVSASAATNITVTDTLPAGLTFVSGTGSGWTCGAVGLNVTCTNPGPLAAGASSDITLTVDVDGTAVPGVANTATVSTPGDSNAANNSSTDNVTVNAAAAVDLAVAKSHSGYFVVGAPGSFTVTVSNVSASAATNITVTDTLPAGLTFASGTGPGWTCGAVGLNVTCTNPGPLAAGTSSAITLTVNVDGAAVPGVTNTITVSTPGDANPANNSDTDNVTVYAVAPTSSSGTSSAASAGALSSVIIDPGLVKFGDPQNARPGEEVTWTLIATNNGNVPLNNVVVRDGIDNTLVEAILGTTTTRGTVTVTAGEVIFTLGTLSPAESVTMTITARLRGSVPPDIYENTAVLRADERPDPLTAVGTISVVMPALPGRLPATGYPPDDPAPDPTGALLIGSVLVGAAVLFILRRRA